MDHSQSLKLQQNIKICCKDVLQHRRLIKITGSL